MITEQQLGPFLCKASSNSMGFWMSLGPGNLNSIIEIFIDVAGQNGPLKVRLEPNTGEPNFGVYVGETGNSLQPNTKYTYSVKIDGHNWLPDGLEQSDYFFWTHSEDPEDLEFVLISCHGVEAYQHDPKNNKAHTWRMWDRLLAYLEKDDACRIGILGGDQVYMDDTFNEDLSKFKDMDSVTAQECAYETYVKYWGHKTYRKVMARLPCVLMWDDHDLIDGWGSREAALLKKNRKVWENYGALLTSAFSDMQATRNPGIIDQKSGFSFSFNIGKFGFIGLDLRKGRQILDSGKSQMMTSEHRQEVERAFLKLSSNIKTLFVISPVTVARMGGNIERLLGSTANLFWSFGKWLGYGKSISRVAAWFTIFSILYFALHLSTHNAPGVVQSSLLALISLTFLGNFENIRKYFPNKYRIVTWSILIQLGVSLLYLGWAIYKAASFESGLWPVVQTGVTRALQTSWEESLITVCLTLFSLIFLGISGSHSIGATISQNHNNWKKAWVVTQKITKWVGIVGVASVLMFNWWRGLPGWKFDYSMILQVILLAVFGLYTLAALLIAILEAVGAIDLVAGLDDDIRDGWSSEANRDELAWLSKVLVHSKTQGVSNITLLCGDIHTGGLSVLKFFSGTESLRIFQVTSSPMSYVTMPDMVEKLTSGSEEFCIATADGEKICTASNIFFRSKRNFAILKASDSEIKAEYHFEDLAQPISLDLR